MKPKIMLFDEPHFGALTGNGQGSARHHGQLGRRRHDYAVRHPRNGLCPPVANRVIFMDQGQIVEQNSPAEFFDNPQHERTRLFLSQILH